MKGEDGRPRERRQFLRGSEKWKRGKEMQPVLSTCQSLTRRTAYNLAPDRAGFSTFCRSSEKAMWTGLRKRKKVPTGRPSVNRIFSFQVEFSFFSTSFLKVKKNSDNSSGHHVNWTFSLAIIGRWFKLTFQIGFKDRLKIYVFSGVL